MAVSLPHHLSPRALLAILALGGTRQPARLARELGTGREELARLVERLREAGIEIRGNAAQGYAWPVPIELLDADLIRSALREIRMRIHHLEIPFEVDSTSTRLLALLPPPPGSANVCATELQHAGRGRRGRAWIAPFGASLALSLGWTFRDAASATPVLSLAVGLAVSRALERFGAAAIRLKWPNDIWLDDRKLGGVLVERRSDAGGPAHVVIGIGLNMAMPEDTRRRIEALGVRVASLSDACSGMVSRNALTAALLEELLGMLGEFESRGFAAFRAEWSARDALCGRGARLHRADETVEGTVRGVDADGALLLEVGGNVQRHLSGEVSLRLSEGEA
jgi:BirA family biotin operon repressor/biotin-[acetyl-CoA-carboxylase] ligase